MNPPVGEQPIENIQYRNFFNPPQPQPYNNLDVAAPLPQGQANNGLGIMQLQLPQPDPSTGITPRIERPYTEREQREREARKKQLSEKYSKCILDSLREYMMISYGYIIPGSNLEAHAPGLISAIFMNNDNFLHDEKQQILNIYIAYYNRLLRLKQTNFQQNYRFTGERADQANFVSLFKEAVNPPTQELNDLLDFFYNGDFRTPNNRERFNTRRLLKFKMRDLGVGSELTTLPLTQFITHGQSTGHWSPPMSIPGNLIDIMLKRFDCFLDYCYELDPDYNYGNYIPTFNRAQPVPAPFSGYGGKQKRRTNKAKRTKRTNKKRKTNKKGRVNKKRRTNKNEKL